MRASDTSEKGLETIIVNSLVNEAGYQQGDSKDYDREHAVDLMKLSEFVRETQPKAYEQLSLGEDSPAKRSFSIDCKARLSREALLTCFVRGSKTDRCH